MWFPALAHHPSPERETSPRPPEHAYIYIHVRTYIYVCVSVCPCVPAARTHPRAFSKFEPRWANLS